MADWTDFYRSVNALVKIGLDECSNTFGSGACDAAGIPDCYYSYAHCRAKTKYSKTIRWFYFTLNAAAPIAGCLPFIKSMPTKLGAQIKPDQFLTAPASNKITFLDPSAVGWTNPSKPYNSAVNNLETAGTFWRNLIARIPHYQGRPLEIWTGLKGKPLTEFHCYFRGVIDTIEFAPGEATISTRDKLSLLERRTPMEQDSENVLTAVIGAGDGIIPVWDAEQYAEAMPTLIKQAVIEDDISNLKEYIEYTGRDLDSNFLTGCRRGCYGTAAVSHGAGCKVKNAVIIAATMDPPAPDWDGVAGLPLDICYLDLLCNHGGLGIAETCFVDVGLSLYSWIDAAGDLVILGIDNMPSNGVILCEDEAIKYGAAPIGGNGHIVIDEEPWPPTEKVTVDEELGPSNYDYPISFPLGSEEKTLWIKFHTGPNDFNINRVGLRLKKSAGATIKFNCDVRIYSDYLGKPSGNGIGLVHSFFEGSIYQTYQDLWLVCDLPCEPSTAYWLCCYYHNGSGAGYLYQAKKTGTIETEFGKNLIDNFVFISGFPLFRIERMAAHGLGQGAGIEKWHWIKFTAAQAATINQIKLYLYRSGAVAGYLTASIWTDSAGNPGECLSNYGMMQLSLLSDVNNNFVPRFLNGSLDIGVGTYWLGLLLNVTGGAGLIYQYLSESALTTEYKHSALEGGPYTGIAGLPLFAVLETGEPLGVLENCERGAYGTTPAEHATGTPVYISQFSRETSIWRSGALFKERILKSISLKDAVQNLRKSSFTQIWQAADGLIHFSAEFFSLANIEVPHLTDALHLKEKNIKLDRQEEVRRTRVIVYYAPLEEDPGTDTLKWSSAILQVDLPLETANYLAKKLGEAIYGTWIYRQPEALYLAAHYLALYKAGASLLTVQIDAKDAHDIPEGSEVQITTDLAVGPTGQARSRVRYFVLAKFMISDTFWELLCLDITGGRDDLNYCVISDLSYGYDDASESEKRKYGWIGSPGDPPAGNRVGAAMVPGYLIQ